LARLVVHSRLKILCDLYIWLLIVPTVAKIFEEFPASVKIAPFNSSPILDLSLELPFSWVILYAAALMFVIARLLYVFFCPRFLREYASAGEAQIRGLTVQYIASEARDFLRAYFRKGFPLIQVEKDNLNDILEQYRVDSTRLIIMMELNRPIGSELAELLERKVLNEDSRRPDRYRIEGNGGDLVIEKDQFFKHVFWDLTRFQDASFPIARAICSLLVVFGSNAVLYVALEGALFVMQVVAK